MTSLSLADYEDLTNNNPYLKKSIERSLACKTQNYDKFLEILYSDLDFIYQQLQTNPQLHQDKKEDQITDDLIRDLNIYGYYASHDKSSGGHVDITVILGSTSQSLSWIGEAKIYRTITDLEEGFLQLSTRYRPASGNFNHNQCGLLIYVFRPDTKTLIEEWREHLKNTFTNTSNDIDDFKTNPFAFFSDFKHDSGLVFKVRHMPLCLHCAPKDKSARSRKKPNSVN
jgi:hypothetical protein